MKKIILLLALLPALAFSKGRPSDAAQSGPISIEKYPRVLILEHASRTISADGEILVCMPPASSLIRGSVEKCIGLDGKNAWLRATDINITGFKLAAYEFTMVGSAGWPKLILYFSTK